MTTNTGLGRRALRLLHERDAVEAGHLQVGEDDVGRELLELAERLEAVGGRLGRVALVAQDLARAPRARSPRRRRRGCGPAAGAASPARPSAIARGLAIARSASADDTAPKRRVTTLAALLEPDAGDASSACSARLLPVSAALRFRCVAAAFPTSGGRARDGTVTFGGRRVQPQRRHASANRAREPRRTAADRARAPRRPAMPREAAATPRPRSGPSAIEAERGVDAHRRRRSPAHAARPGRRAGAVPRRLHDRVLLGGLPLHARSRAAIRETPTQPRSRQTATDHIGGRLTLSMQVAEVARDLPRDERARELEPGEPPVAPPGARRQRRSARKAHGSARTRSSTSAARSSSGSSTAPARSVSTAAARARSSAASPPPTSARRRSASRSASA